MRQSRHLGAWRAWRTRNAPGHGTQPTDGTGRSLSPHQIENRHETPGVIEIRGSGELDLVTAPQKSEALAGASSAGGVLLNLTGAPFLDSSGIAVLVAFN